MSGIVSQFIAAGIFWWLAVTTWFHWLTVIFVVGAVTSTGLVALFVWARRRERVEAD